MFVEPLRKWRFFINNQCKKIDKMKEIIKQNNLRLMQLLIPKGDEPITGSVTDPKSEVFNNKIYNK